MAKPRRRRSTAALGAEQVAIERRLREILPGAIQREREARGLTQEQLADKAGIHWTTVGKIERGKLIPSVALLAVLARALDMNLMELLAPALPPPPGAPSGDDDDAIGELTKTLPKPERRKLLPVLQALLKWKGDE